MFKKNLKNFSFVAPFLSFLFSFMAMNWAQACGSGLSISSVTLSTASVASGQTFGVTVVYQQTAGWNQVYFLGGFDSTQTTFQACGTSNQVFDLYTGVGGTGNSANPPSGNGWGPLNPGGTGPATAVFTVTASASLTPGTNYNYIIGVSGCDAQCGDLANMEAEGSAAISILPPPPSCAATVVSETTTAAPNGLYLFDVDYSFANSGNTDVVCPLPANLTFQSAGPNGVYVSGSNSVSWYLGNIVATQTGVLWALVSVNSGTPSGTVINIPSGTFNAPNCGGLASFPSSASVTIQTPQVALLKSQNVSSLSAGQTVTYALDWTTTGNYLQIYDSYDNDAVGTTNGSIVGYDGTPYTQYAAQIGDLGTWAVSQVQGNNYIVGMSVSFSSAGTVQDYPALIRSGPGVNICSGFTVQGDLQIPTVAPGATNGDCAMIVAVNPSQGVTMAVAISQNNTPDYFYFQKNQNYDASIYPSPMGTNNLPLFPTGGPGNTPIIPGNWYTVAVNVQFSGSGPITYTGILWPTGIPSDAATFVYIDPNNASDIPNNPGTITGCSCGWLQGWQTYCTTQIDYFANLEVYGGGSVVNATLTDAVPPGVTYLGASPLPTSGAPAGPLVWNFPASVTDQCPVSWWGTVACPGPIVNSFTMSANSIAVTTSNSVTLTLTGCTTPGTPTPTPTVTPSMTPTSSPTPTITSTPTITPTPVNTATFTPTPVGLHVWPNPFDTKYAVPAGPKNLPALIAYQVPLGATMSIYTVSGESVVNPALTSDATGHIYWYGTNSNGMACSPGIYYYVIQNGNSTLLNGKILLLRD